jgi:predicted anti-sigma-YlaC factor YlaD
MDCKEVKQVLCDYMENNLTERPQIQIKSHLDSCDSCSKIYQKLNQSLELLKPTSEIPEQAFYFTRLKQKMENKNSGKESILFILFSRKIIQPVIYLASLVIAVYIGILIGSSSPTRNQYSELESINKDPLETFAEYNYLNDLEIETIENMIIEEEE